MLPEDQRSHVRERTALTRSGAGLAALLSGECDIVDRVHGLQDFELLLELQA